MKNTPQPDDHPRVFCDEKITWTLKPGGDDTHYGTVIGRDECSYIIGPSPESDGSWILSARVGCLWLAVANLSTLTEAQVHAHWIEANNEADYREINWEEIGDELCVANPNASVLNGYRILRTGNGWDFWVLKGWMNERGVVRSGGEQRIATFGNREEAIEAAERLNRHFTVC
jgi:hypothetical protein